MAESKRISSRQEHFIEHYTKGMSASEAARAAGYAPGYSKKASAFILSQPQIKAAVAAVQGQLRETVQYEVVDAVREVDAMLVFAKDHKNAMAAAKLLELKMKLFGLLVDKLDVRHAIVDLGGALLEARKRAMPQMVEAVEYVMRPAVDPFSEQPS